MQDRDSSKTTAERQLRSHIDAFIRMDLEALHACFHEYAIVDCPMIEPTRLCGLPAIRRGLELASTNIDQVDVMFSEIVANADSAMGSGQLSLECRGEPATHEFAISARCVDGKLARLSWYFDARGSRRWTDRAAL